MTSLARIVTGPDGAPTLVLLHGITGSAVSLAEAIDHWADRGYRVVAVDARGHGLSPRWTQAQLERAGEVLVEDLIAVLEDLEAASRGRDALGLSTSPAPVVIGHSMGAATAMVAAGRRPDLVSGVVLEDPARFGT
ncbi:alpha/beta hydrolase, partial [Actinomyces stomatis]|uniref:alpha/beta hydrolase n=1 Tax=Actinomyces stomatis TaxID=3050227 RepID=UPI0028528398